MKKQGIKWVCKELGKAVLAFWSAYVGAVGCYPMLPAFFALCSRKGQASLLVMVGALAGIVSFMPLEIMLKYIFVLAVIGIGIKLYVWSNRYCGHFVVALIASVSVIAMNIAGNIFALNGVTLVWAGLFEGMMVLGLTLVLQWLVKIPYQWMYQLDTERKKKPFAVLQEKEQQTQRM